MRRWAAKQRKLANEVKETITEEEAEMGREVGRLYALILKTKQPFAKLIPAGKRIEDTRWWAHFVKAGRLIKELEADPRMYLQAQFDRLAWKKGAYPFPTQLHSDSALAAYVERQGRYIEKVWRREHSAVAVMEDPFKLEQRKLDTWAKRLGVSAKRVLKDHPNEFTAAFHRSKGTWALVREQFHE